MRATLSVLLLCLVGCASGLPERGSAGANFDALPALAPALAPNAATTPIQHIVIIVQENRTVDNLFNGYPNADTVTSGKMSNGRTVTLQPVALDSADIDNTYGDSREAFDGGKMDGFDQTGGQYAYSYVNRHDSAPYWKIAQEFELADKMFTTAHGESWAAHIDLIASTTNLSKSKAMIDFPSSSPWDCEAPVGTATITIDSQQNKGYGPYPCFAPSQLHTMAESLDAARVSWRFYAAPIDGDYPGSWSAFGSIKNVKEGPDWKKVVSPPPTILNDVAKGKLAAVTWVTPEWAYSDHAGNNQGLGPSWVAAIVNAVGKSKFWHSTAIVVVWDDYGGWYDHVPPPQLDFKGLGIRVPCLIVSPYVHAARVDHTQYEFGSILRFVEDNFSLPRLGTVPNGYSDARAASLSAAFDFSMKPRAFKPIPAPSFPY